MLSILYFVTCSFYSCCSFGIFACSHVRLIYAIKYLLTCLLTGDFMSTSSAQLFTSIYSIAAQYMMMEGCVLISDIACRQHLRSSSCHQLFAARHRQAIIFLPCGFFAQLSIFLSLFFPRLISAVADWMSVILLLHMAWP